jgi:hypothetical protein
MRSIALSSIWDPNSSPDMPVVVVQIPFSEYWQRQADSRRNMAKKLRGLQPSRTNSMFMGTCRQTLRLINAEN